MAESTATSNPRGGERAQLLLAMYRSTWDNVNRHILVVWQSIGALTAAFAASYLSGKATAGADIGTALVVVATAWAGANVIDASGWFNRNLYIIRNIERQLLAKNDGLVVHPFFLKPARTGMIEHLRIQLTLIAAVGALALLQHFLTRVLPFLDLHAKIDFARWTPYVIVVAAVPVLGKLHKHVQSQFLELVRIAPGEDPD